jgi:hypothetical protein
MLISTTSWHLYAARQEQKQQVSFTDLKRRLDPSQCPYSDHPSLNILDNARGLTQRQDALFLDMNSIMIPDILL